MTDLERLKHIFEHTFEPKAVHILTNEWNRTILRVEFADATELEDAFTDLIGNPFMLNCASKAIGSTVLIWHR